MTGKKTQSIMLYVFLITIFVVLLFFIMTPAKSTSARISGEKAVKSVLVCNGDSLWSIAKENYSELSGSLQEYVKEIRTTNQMSSDAVQTGTYLLVPYYTID